MAAKIPTNIEKTRDKDHGWASYTFPSEKREISITLIIITWTADLQCTEVLCFFLSIYGHNDVHFRVTTKKLFNLPPLM